MAVVAEGDPLAGVIRAQVVRVGNGDGGGKEPIAKRGDVAAAGRSRDTTPRPTQRAQSGSAPRHVKQMGMGEPRGRLREGIEGADQEGERPAMVADLIAIHAGHAGAVMGGWVTRAESAIS